MSMKFRFPVAVAILLTFAVKSFGQGGRMGLYIDRDRQPDAGIYLPAPPDTCSLTYVDDFLQWQWGKTMRSSARGEQANDESLWGPQEMMTIYSQALGIEINRENTPALYKLIFRSTYTGDQSTKSAKEKYMRTRPFAQYNEHPWGRHDNENDLRHNGSYPSGHTGIGWTNALILAEVAPELQDTVLRRGFQYGESRIIVAAHYQSDVDAGYLCASACVAVMHSVPDFIEDLEAARAEFLEKSKLKSGVVTGYPDGRRILAQPVDTASYRYYGDVTQYLASKAERYSSRGMQARTDADYTYEAILSSFSAPLGVRIDPVKTPNLAALVREGRNALVRNASDLSNASAFRKRPYVQIGDSSFLSESDSILSVTSSYPSVQSETGWGIALLLSEIAPERANELLSRGFETGRSAVINGQNWASDVQAARLMAAATVARLHSDAAFSKLLRDARKEYISLK